MKLIVVHSHYRPGGVRRVIELGLPHLAAALTPPVSAIVLAGGERPPALWLAALRRTVPRAALTCSIQREFGYLSEIRITPAAIVRRVRSHLDRLLRGTNPGNCVVWYHNPALGRNLVLVRELAAACAQRGVPLIAHHHDWWFDNRWQRWPEMCRAGFRSLDAVAAAMFPTSGLVRHAAINRTDYRVLSRHLGRKAAWVPNLQPPAAPTDPAGGRRASRWLGDQLGDHAPVWLMPCRLLRRKNMAEALLLTRWLRPDAWLVTTGAISSAEECAYGDALARGARKYRWRLRLGILPPDESDSPSVPALMAASEAVLLTSLQEGFGLPALEAAVACRPLLLRNLPNVAPDLEEFGFRFPQAYDELRVDPRLFDWAAEWRRQQERWHTWREQLPREVRGCAREPPLLARGPEPRPVAFSRLTLVAQLEVLAGDRDQSWAWCLRLNPFLGPWRDRAVRCALIAPPWPTRATLRLSGDAYRRNLTRLLRGAAAPLNAAIPAKILRDFWREKLAGGNQYPLLWTTEP